MNAQIMVMGPFVPSSYVIDQPKFGAATYFNGKVQSESDLIEIGTASSK